MTSATQSTPRTREYLAAQRILWQSGAIVNAAYLLRIGSAQASCWNSAPGLSLQPGAAVLLDFGRELYGGIRLVTGRFPGPRKRRRLRVRFGESASEAMSEPDYGHGIQDGVIELATLSSQEFGSTGFRFVRLDNTDAEPIELRSIAAVSIYRQLPLLGAFECDDSLLNEIWQTSVYTVQLCLQEYAWDGIKRDRLVWMGDLFPELLVVSHVFGKQKIIEKSMDFLRDETPLPQMMNGCATYTLWWIIGQYMWFQQFGDREYLEEQRTYLVDLLTLLAAQVGEDGRGDLKNGWQILDWATGVEEENSEAIWAGNQALLEMALERGRRLCRCMGAANCETACRQALARMHNYLPPLTYSKAGNALLVLSGRHDAATVNREYFQSEPLRGLSTFLGCFVLAARARAGDYAACLDTLRGYWGGMLKLGATTFWEHFDISYLDNAARIDELPPPGRIDVHGTKGKGCYQGFRHSLCHGWAGGPAAWLMRYILGVKFNKADEIILQPQLAGLQWCRGSVPTRHGRLFLEITEKSGRPKVEYNAPKGVTVICADEKNGVTENSILSTNWYEQMRGVNECGF